MTKKQYSIAWEHDKVVGLEVNGVRYTSLGEVPLQADRLKLQTMIEAAGEPEVVRMPLGLNKRERERQVSAEQVIVWVFSGVAALMLVISFFSTFSTLQKMSREEETPGLVVDVVEQIYRDAETDSINKFYYPVVEFKTREGRRFNLQLIEGSNPASYESGDEVTILYEPENPSSARIRSVGSTALMWIAPVITGILGFGFLAAVLAVQRFLFSE